MSNRPESKNPPMTDEEIAEMVNTGKGLEGWKPANLSELMSLLSNEQIPLDKASEVVSQKSKDILPLADQDTLDVTFTE